VRTGSSGHIDLVSLEHPIESRRMKNWMKAQPSCIVLLLALLIGVSVGVGQEPAGRKRARTEADYQARTLKEVVKTSGDTESRGDKKDTFKVYGDFLPSRVRATYTGSSRPLPQKKKDVLLQWARLYAGYPEGFTAPYQTEMLFVEKGVKYWLSVRQEDLPRYQEEMKKGDAIDLFLLRLGAARISRRWESMILVENFQKMK
jgi:hypothetical protein